MVSPSKKGLSKTPVVGAEISVTSLTKERIAGFADVYANNASTAAGFYDVAIVFSEIQPRADDVPVVMEKCRVTMNPAHGKALAEALSQTVRKWEATFGKIKLPAGMIGAEKKDEAP